MQKRVVLPLLLALALGACRSSEPEPTETLADSSSVACTCGDPMTAIEGCANPVCASGERNPDNPDCVCGDMIIIEEGQ